MKLLFGENLSHKLVGLVQSLFPDSAHVTTIGLEKGTPDREIWDFAKQNEFTIVTGDRDFLALSHRLGPPAQGDHFGVLRLPGISGSPPTERQCRSHL